MLKKIYRLRALFFVAGWCCLVWLFIALSFAPQRVQNEVSEDPTAPPRWFRPHIALQERYLSVVAKKMELEPTDAIRSPMMYACCSICAGWGDRFYYLTIGLISAMASRRPFFAYLGFPEDALLYYTPRYISWNLTDIPTRETLKPRLKQNQVRMPGLTEDQHKQLNATKFERDDLFVDNLPISLKGQFSFGKAINENQSKFSVMAGAPDKDLEGQLLYVLLRPTELIYQAFLRALESFAWQLDVVDRGTLALDFLDEPKFRYFFFEEFGRDPSYRLTYKNLFERYGNPAFLLTRKFPLVVGIHTRTRPDSGFEYFHPDPWNFNNTARLVPCAKEMAPKVLSYTDRIAYFCASDAAAAKDIQRPQGCITLETTEAPEHVGHPKHNIDAAVAGVGEMIVLSLSDMLIGTHSGYVSWAKYMNYAPTNRAFRYPPFGDIKNCTRDIKKNHTFKDLRKSGRD